MEDLGLAALMGDGEAPVVGGGQPEVGATARPLQNVPAGAERAPAREPAVEYAKPTTSVPMASYQIPTLIGTQDVAVSIPTL